MKKKIILSLVSIFLLTGCGKVPQLANGEEAMVSFDDASINISANDVYDALKDKYALNVIIDMIDKNILLKEYPKDEKKALEDAKDQIEKIKPNYVNDDGKYQEELLINALKEYYGIDNIEDFEKMLVLSYYRNKAIEDYAKKQVTDKQIEKEYNDNIVGDIEASHILIAVNAKDDMKEDEIKELEKEALKKAEDIIKKLDKGEKLEDLAKKHSDDTGSAKEGGKLGYFNKGDMQKEFEDAAYKLELNKYTKKPIKTKFGYHIILKTGEKDKPKLKDVKKDILKDLSYELLNKDNTMSLNAIIELRKAYGFKIEDSNVNKQYSTYTSNQLISLRNQANQ